MKEVNILSQVKSGKLLGQEDDEEPWSPKSPTKLLLQEGSVDQYLEVHMLRSHATISFFCTSGKTH